MCLCVSACVYVYTSVCICDSMHVQIFQLGCFQVSSISFLDTVAALVIFFFFFCR